MNCFRFGNFMNNATVVKTFNSNNSNITYIMTQLCQILATITYRIMKFEPMIIVFIVFYSIDLVVFALRIKIVICLLIKLCAEYKINFISYYFDLLSC